MYKTLLFVALLLCVGCADDVGRYQFEQMKGAAVVAFDTKEGRVCFYLPSEDSGMVWMCGKAISESYEELGELTTND